MCTLHSQVTHETLPCWLPDHRLATLHGSLLDSRRDITRALPPPDLVDVLAVLLMAKRFVSSL